MNIRKYILIMAAVYTFGCTKCMVVLVNEKTKLILVAVTISRYLQYEKATDGSATIFK